MVVRTADPAEKTTENRQAIVEAATRLFARDGYVGTSMDQVAAEAGVAKQTVYNHFAGKEALLQAIVSGLVERLASLLPQPDLDTADLGATLFIYARRFVGMLIEPESLGLFRVLVAEAPRHPVLARLGYDTGVTQSAARLARYLEAQVARGALEITDCALAAEQFMGTLRGNIQICALLLGGNAPSMTWLDHYARSAVDAFLRAHAPAARPARREGNAFGS